MIKYVIKGDGVKEVLDKTEDILDIIAKFKAKHPTVDYDISLDAPLKGDVTWTINLDINDGKFKEEVFTK